MTQIDYIRTFKDGKWSEGYREVSEQKGSRYRLPYTIVNRKQVEKYLKEFNFKKADKLYKRLSHKYPASSYFELKKKYLIEKEEKEISDIDKKTKLDTAKKSRNKNMTGKLCKIIIRLENAKYLWNGIKWINLENFKNAPKIITQQLNKKLIKIVRDYTKLPYDVLKKMASNLKKSNDFKMASKIIDYLLEMVPGDPVLLSILSSLLRNNGNSKEALKRTEEYNYKKSSLLTSRAAAMCDLKLWKEAKKEVGKALAIAKFNNEKQEAFKVVDRIKSNAPYLYKNN